MVLKVITYPNKNLFMKSKPVENFDENLHKFLDDLYDTMRAYDGIGISAIQVDKPIRAMLVLIPRQSQELDENGEFIAEQFKEDLLEIINPQFIELEGEQICKEGCLSVPDFYEDVKRAKNIKLKFFDRFGKEQILNADGLKAVCIQHEYDHLEGHLFIEKIGYTKRKKFDKDYKAKIKELKAKSEN